MLLSTAYIPPYSFFTCMAKRECTIFDLSEIYQKQSYRNRCRIVGANGIQDLTIPVKLPDGSKSKMCDVEIDYSTDWNRIHWNSIISAYGSSPFFEYYKDDLEPFYKNKWRKLWEFNDVIIKTMLKSINFECSIEYAKDQTHLPTTIFDARYSIHPKAHRIKYPLNFKTPKYRQIFETKHGFIEDLSIIDLLFNKGPESYEIILKSNLVL